MLKLFSQPFVFSKFLIPLFLGFLLAACGGGGGSDALNNSTTTGTQDTPLASPTGVTLTKDFNAKTIKISWAAVPKAKSYTVYSAQQSASALGKNGFTNHSTLNGHAIKAGVTATEFTLSDLTQGKTYYVLVQAVNDSTQSPYKASDEKSAALIRFEKMTGANAGKCVIDLKKNMMWEVKQDDTGLHGKDHTYTWYQTTNNGDNSGTQNKGTCYNKKTSSNPDGNACDTTGFVSSVNNVGLCGHKDWRMPTKEELLSLVDQSRKTANTPPMIDMNFFPNTQNERYRSSSPYPSQPSHAWVVDFNKGNEYSSYKHSGRRVRLVRAR